MSTAAKRASNARYNGKFKMVALRVPNEEVETLTAAAAAAGESLAGYAWKATKERMEQDGFTPSSSAAPMTTDHTRPACPGRSVRIR